MKRLLVFLICLLAWPAFAQPINTLPAASTPLSPTNTVVGVQGGAAVQMTVQSIANLATTTALNITRAQIATTSIGANKTIQVNGYRTSNDLGNGAIYTSVNATSGGLNAIQDSGGIWFNEVLNGVLRPGYFGAYADGGAHTIASGDITANPQWRGCYPVGTSWDAVALQEEVFAANAPGSTAAAPGCTPPTAPVTLSNIVWLATSAGGYNYAGNTEIDVPNGNYGVNRTITQVASHFRVVFQSRAALISWTPTTPGVIWYCDACSYYQRFNFSLANQNAQSYGSQQPLYVNDWDGTYNSLKPQQGTDYDPMRVLGTNGEGWLISPSSTAQGDTLTEVNPLSAGFYSLWAVQLATDNALEYTTINGDCQGFVYACKLVNGGTFYDFGSHYENQTVNDVNFVIPYLTMIGTGGADNLCPVGVSTAGANIIKGGRTEGDVLSLAFQGCFTDVENSEIVGTDFINRANSHAYLPGTLTAQSKSTGNTWYFMLVEDGNNSTPRLMTSGTANTITDSTQSWTTNQWVGYAMFYRFGSNGFVNVCTITSNTATTLTGSSCGFPATAAATSMYEIVGVVGGSPPSWSSAAKGKNTFNAGAQQGLYTTAGGTIIGFGSSINPQVGDYIIIPNAVTIAPGGSAPTFIAPLYAKVTATGTSCPVSFPGSLSCVTVNNAPTFALSNVGGYTCTPLTDGNEKWCNVLADNISGALQIIDTQGINLIGPPFGQIEGMTANRDDWQDLSEAGSNIVTNAKPLYNYAIAGQQSAISMPTVTTTIDLTSWAKVSNLMYVSPTSGNTTFSISTTGPRGEVIHVIMPSPGNSYTVTWGSGFNIPAQQFTTTWVTPTSGEWDFTFVYDGTATGWTEIAGPNVANAFANPPVRVSSNWYMTTPIVATNFTTASVTTTYFTPLLIYKAVTVQALGVFLATGQTSGKIQLAVYADNGSGVPMTAGGPLMSTGDITATSSTVNVSGSVTATLLQPGYYWAAVMSNNTGIVVDGVNNNNPYDYIAGLSGASSQNNLRSTGGSFLEGYTLTGQTYGTWPTSGTPATTTAVVGPLLQYESQ